MDMTHQEMVRVGCFTGETGGPPAVGIHTFTLDGTPLSAAAADNPSYLLLHPGLPVLYALSEREPTHVAAFRIEGDGSLTAFGRVATGGDGGCHLAFDPTGAFVVVAHYSVGSVSVVSIGADGELLESTSSVRFTGSGPDPERQEASHAHMAVAYEDEVLVPDLGTDQIHRLHVDADGGITEREPITVPAGSGPRHLVITGDHLVLACELSADLWLARRDGDSWREIGPVRSTRADPSAPVYPSAIVAPADRVIVANRGPNTFATFGLDRSADTLTLLNETPTGGDWPRDLTVRDGEVWVANQNSYSVTVFAPDGDGWTLSRTIECPSPGCIVFTRS